MSSKYDFILDNVRFSYSAVSTYGTCPYAYKLTYIDAEPRIGNFYSEFGLLIHDCLEKFFLRELDIFELSDYYKDNYNVFVVSPSPSYPVGLDERYRQEGQKFFDNFSFNIDDYETLIIEGTIDFSIRDIKFTARPDLVLKRKSDGKVILYDYKTSTPFWIDKRTGDEKRDNEKINGYKKQLSVYTYAVRTVRRIQLDEIAIWYPRMDRIETYPWNLHEEEENISFLMNTISQIKGEDEFPYNTKNPYFCKNLCGVRNSCEYA